MVAWIWAATGIMALGGLVALVPVRRRDVTVRVGAVTPSADYGALPDKAR
jgi:hypothetical protein